MKSRVSLLVSIVGLCNWLPNSAGGAPVTFDFSGVISGVVPGNPNYPYDDADPQVGDPFTGRFSFDASELADINASATVGDYWFAPGYYGANLWLGLSYSGHSYGYGIGVDFSDNWRVVVTNSAPGQGADMIQLYMESGPIAEHSLSLVDSRGTALNSDVLPATINLSDWTNGTAIRNYGPYDPHIVTFQITGFPPVPDIASTGLLLVTVMLVLAGSLRRRSCSKH